MATKANELLDDVFTTLTDGSLIGGATGWTGYKGNLPDTPDKSVAIMSIPGVASTPTWEIIQPEFQIIVRSEEDDFNQAQTQIQSINDLLDLGNAALNTASNTSDYVYCLSTSSNYISFGKDSQGRFTLGRSYRTMIRS